MRWYILCAALFAVATLGGQVITSPNYTAEQANGIITNTTAYVQSVNQSAFLVFYPNLTMANYYLRVSKSIYKTNPSEAVFYARQAAAAASAAYSGIALRKGMGLFLATVFTIAMGAALYVFMKPIYLRKA
jgi:hypothetical protein